MKILTSLFAVFLLILFFSCQHASIYDCTGVTPTYTKNVKPILDSYCAMPDMGCHSAGNAEGGINLGDYSGASSVSSKKKFMGSIEHLKGYKNMPQGGVMIPDEKIHILSCWVENGSPE
jgi:hypothetical protein